MIRLHRMLLGGTIAIAMVPLGALPASAHTGLVLTMHDDGRGGVTVDLAWDDGHPIPNDSPIAASFLASSADRMLGPTALRKIPDRPTAAYDGTLPPGTWTVYVDAALPGIGQCEATVVVAAEPRPASTTQCGKPTPASAAPAVTPAAQSAPEPSRTPLYLGLGAIALATAAGVGFLITRRRRT